MKSRLQLRQRGLSLVEVMVSLVIGLVVIGVVLSTYLGAGVGGRHSSAMAQITEDATVALNIMRAQIEMAGFSQPNAVDTDGRWAKAYAGSAIFGCDKGFKDAKKSLQELIAGGCNAEGSNDAIAIAYQADASTVVVTSDGTPADCLGQNLPLDGGIYVAYNRFYVDTGADGVTPALYCRGNGGGDPSTTSHQPLVENIVGLQLNYGVANVATPTQVARYRNAADLAPDDWNRVIAVRVCVVVQSADNVMDEATAYYGCDGTKVDPADGDRKMYRAFHSTIVLHNRLGAPA
ncbi:PilW family protein [Eleftheria terrae]|uniref:PilW family protein n=1 Tax=Eleftheria terrae TaxID=1597781 RepID=UPI00263B09D8|nr:PilW family protein [Eleftheria terrae]WKB52419.1 PilW family protein [Eleftheria terrae]